MPTVPRRCRHKPSGPNHYSRRVTSTGSDWKTSVGILGAAQPELTERAMADTPDVRPVGDLPNEIGKTAARELSVNSITSLEQVGRRLPEELLDIHGVGPKAIRILGQALDAEGLWFKDP